MKVQYGTMIDINSPALHFVTGTMGSCGSSSPPQSRATRENNTEELTQATDWSSKCCYEANRCIHLLAVEQFEIWKKGGGRSRCHSSHMPPHLPASASATCAAAAAAAARTDADSLGTVICTCYCSLWIQVYEGAQNNRNSGWLRQV